MTDASGPLHRAAAREDPRFLLVTSCYSALRSSLESGRFEPTGMPAVAELWLGLRRHGIPFDHVLVDSSPVAQPVWQTSLPEFTGTFVLLGARRSGPLARAGLRLRLLWHLARLLRRGRHDLVYVDREHLWLGAVLAWLLRRPVVLRLHGVALLPRQDERRGLRPMRWLRRLALRAPFALIIASQDGTPVEPFLDRWARRETPRRLWLNGVPPRLLAPADEPVAAGEPDEPDEPRAPDEPSTTIAPPVLLFVGRLVGDKGIELFLAAIRALARRRSDFRAVVAGDGPLMPAVEAAARELPMLRALGAVPHSEVHRLYRDAAVYLSLNELGNLNNTVLEALATGSCIVSFGASAATGRDVSTERLLGEAVRFVPREVTPDGLAAELSTLLDAPALRREYGERARAAAARLLGPWEERIDREVAVLARLAAGGEVDG